jgi:hypothetical protein
MGFPARSSTNVSPRARSSGRPSSLLVGLVVQEVVESAMTVSTVAAFSETSGRDLR